MDRSVAARKAQRSPSDNGRGQAPCDVGGDDPPAEGELALIAREIALRTGAEIALVACWSPAQKCLGLISAWGDPLSVDRSRSPRGRFGRFVGRVLESGHAAIEPLDASPDVSLRVVGAGARLTYAAGAAVRPPGGPPGASCVGLAGAPEDPAVTLWMLERYAGLAALCLYDPGVLEGWLAAACIDGLTGCVSYAAIHTELDREIGRAERHGRPVSCCFIDLDGFKRVNDQHGSRVLAEVAEILRGGLRAGDTLGRYAGDEFVAVLPGTDQAAACVLAERLRSTISATKLGGGQEPLDASVGVAQWDPGQSVEELLAAADSALLHARATGGARVVRAGDVAAGAARDVTTGPDHVTVGRAAAVSVRDWMRAPTVEIAPAERVE